MAKIHGIPRHWDNVRDLAHTTKVQRKYNNIITAEQHLAAASTARCRTLTYKAKHNKSNNNQISKIFATCWHCSCLLLIAVGAFNNTRAKFPAHTHTHEHIQLHIVSYRLCANIFEINVFLTLAWHLNALFDKVSGASTALHTLFSNSNVFLAIILYILSASICNGLLLIAH